MPSLASRAIPAIVRLRGTKRKMRSAAATHADVAALEAKPHHHAPPKRLGRSIAITVRDTGGWPVYEVAPRGITTTQCAVYCHGGAYIHEIDRRHWQLIADLATTTDTRFLVPIYPLAPRGTAAEIVPAVADLAAETIADVGAENSVLIGDSAGGGMALAVAMLLRDRGLPAPRDIVLISPWLDVRVTGPAIDELARRDPFLAPPGLRTAGEMYRGDLAADDPMVSPLSGDLTGLGSITMFSGTRDILNPDARRFAALAAAAGLSVRYHEEPGMIHVYPLLPIPEACRARAVMRSVLAG